jgi:hypothetical protein
MQECHTLFLVRLRCDQKSFSFVDDIDVANVCGRSDE